MNELFEDVRARPHPQLARALERAVLLPLGDAGLAEQVPTVLALHRINRNLQANAAPHRVAELAVHLAVDDSRDVVTALVERLVLVLQLLHLSQAMHRVRLVMHVQVGLVHRQRRARSVDLVAAVALGELLLLHSPVGPVISQSAILSHGAVALGHRRPGTCVRMIAAAGSLSHTRPVVRHVVDRVLVLDVDHECTAAKIAVRSAATAILAAEELHLVE